MDVTGEDLAKIATNYLASQCGSEEHRTKRDGYFKEYVQAFYERDVENEKYVAAHLGDEIERLRRSFNEQFPDKSIDLTETQVLGFLEPFLAEHRLQKALVKEEAGEEKRKEALDPQTLATSAYAKGKTPIRLLQKTAYDRQFGWDEDKRTDRKAYIFACFSEIAYLKYTKFDAHFKKGRYKVVPSEALEHLRTYDMKYDLEEVLAKVTGGEGVAVTVNDPGRGFLYATFLTPQFVVVAVRGTASISDALLIDLKATHNKQGYHKGFYNEAESAMKELKAQTALQFAADNKLPVYFTGHSMGAAIAWIFRHIWGNSHQVMTPYIYASPRIGTNEVSDLFGVYAYTHPYDPVPHLPPLSLSYENPSDVQEIDMEEDVAKWERWVKLFKFHSIEQYRVTLGKKTQDDKFAPDVYFTALFVEMIDTYRVLGQPFPFGLKN